MALTKIPSELSSTTGIVDNSTATAITIDSNENVGIGTTSPNSKLDTGGDYYSGTATTVAQLTNKISTYSTLSQGSLYGFGQDSNGLHMTAGQAGQSLMFHTGGSAERMRIDGSGNLLVGDTSVIRASSQDGVSVEPQGRIYMSRGTGIGGFTHLSFINGNGTVGSVVTSGSSTSYNTSSDYRLKENVVELTGATERLKQLNPSRFNFIADADTTVDGFLAHEVADVVPEAISGEKDAVDADGNPEYQGIDQSKLVPLLVATIQELEARITELENN